MNLRDMKKNPNGDEIVDSDEALAEEAVAEATVEESDVVVSEDKVGITPEAEVSVEESVAEVEEPKVEEVKKAPTKEDVRKKKAEEKLLRDSANRKTGRRKPVSEVVDTPKEANLSEMSSDSGKMLFEAMNMMISQLTEQNDQLRNMNAEMLTEMKKVNSKIVEMLDRPIEPKVVIMQPETTKVITKTITRDANNLIQSVTEKVEDVPVDEKEIVNKKDK